MSSARTKPDCDRCTGSLYYLQGLCTNANRRCSSVILRDTMTLHAMRAATYNPLQDHTELESGRMVPRLLKQGRVIQVANDTQASATRRHVVNLHPLSCPVGIHCVAVVHIICISQESHFLVAPACSVSISAVLTPCTMRDASLCSSARMLLSRQRLIWLLSCTVPLSLTFFFFSSSMTDCRILHTHHFVDAGHADTLPNSPPKIMQAMYVGLWACSGR